MKDPIIIITGSNSGIGLCILQLAIKKSLPYRLILTCRDLNRGNIAMNELIKQFPDFKHKERLFLALLDISDKKSILEFKEWFCSKFPSEKIKILFNNAGCYIDKFSLENVDISIGTNFIGTSIITEEMLELMETNSRIIFMGSWKGRDFFNKLRPEEKKIVKNLKSVEELFSLKNKIYKSIEDLYEIFSKSIKVEEIENYSNHGHNVSKFLIEMYCSIQSKKENIISKNIECYCLDPGWVQTGPGGPNASKTIESGCLLPMEFIEKKFLVNLEEQGKFFGDLGIINLN